MGWRYVFGTDTARRAGASNRIPAHIDLELRAVTRAPDGGDAVAALRAVGEPIIAWVDVTASEAGGALARETGASAINRLLLACTDQAAMLETVPGVESVATGVLVSPVHPLRAIVV